MDRIALIAIEGLNEISTRENLDTFPAFNELVNHAAKGVLTNELPLNWPQAWELVLGGSYKAIEAGKNLINDLPKRGISTLSLSKTHTAETLPEQILADNVKTVLLGIPKKPVDRVDLLVLEITGFSTYLKNGGDPEQYWTELDNALKQLLETFAENTVVFTIAPVDTVSSETGILLAQWLEAENSLQPEALVEIDKTDNLLHFSQKGLEVRDELLEKLRNLKVYARRGGDIRVVEVKSLAEKMIPSWQSGESVYLSPKKASVYLDFTSTPANNRQEAGNFQVKAHKTFYSSDGSLFVSGYKVDTEKELEDISVLSIVPTIRDCFNLEQDWDMVRNSFKYQFSLRVVEEQASASAEGDESAVRSRLEALGY